MHSDFTPCPNTWILAISAVLHGLAALAANMNGLTQDVQMLILATIALHFLLDLRRYLKTDASPALIRYTADGNWQLHFRSESAVTAQLQGTSVSTRWITLLHFETETGTVYSILFCPIGNCIHNYRRLRIALRLNFSD